MLAGTLEREGLSLTKKLSKNGKKVSGQGMTRYKRKPCVIGLDQSYSRCGISIAVEGKLKKVSSIKFKNCHSKSDKRRELQRVLRKAIQSCLKNFDPKDIIVICERLRLFSTNGGNSTIRPNVIKPAAAMISYIVDTADEFGIEVWSVDTRAWKSEVLGDSRPVFEPIEGVSNPQKFGSVRKVIDLGFRESLEIKRGNGRGSTVTLDDDAADSACIALYGNCLRPKLKREL